MKRIIQIQLIVGIILIAIFTLAYFGSLLDVKYIIEVRKGNISDASEAAYGIIGKLSILFGLLATLVTVSSILLLIKSRKKPDTPSNT